MRENANPMLADVLVTGAKRYERVALVAWDCLVPGGDASAAWSACTARRCALQRDTSLGWHGRVATALGPQRLLRLTQAVAAKPWSAIADLEGPLALSLCTSKGDPTAWDAALADHPAALISALAGQLTPQLAGALGCGYFQSMPVAAACSTGLYALLACADTIEHGHATRALAGAADLSLTPLLLAGFHALGVLAGDRQPQAFGEPTGFAPAEGAGIIALADRSVITDRRGWWLVAGVRSGDARHETEFRDPHTLSRALNDLWQAAPHPELIITHGTGTKSGDAYERHGLDHGPWAKIPRLSCKPSIGHCLGASAAVELALGLEAPVSRLWKLGLGFGGHLAAVAVERW